MSHITTHLVVSVGCPCGVGPEVSILGASRLVAERPDTRVTLVGDQGALRDAASRHGVSLEPGVELYPSSTLHESLRRPGAPTPEAGRAQLDAIDLATDRVLAGQADALVTGPVSKATISSAGASFRGHTEHLAQRAGVGRVVMSFFGPRLKVALVTTHVAIESLPARVTGEAVAFTIERAVEVLTHDFSVSRPRVVVAGLNPHAGEGGLLGRDELERIIPALEAARRAHPDAVIDGPMPAESAFRHAKDGRYDLVVAMFHDQATIASKLLDFGDAVNVTLGLPFIRTSVDHGTAYDIAGRGVADARGMLAALRLARAMVAARRAASSTRDAADGASRSARGVP